ASSCYRRGRLSRILPTASCRHRRRSLPGRPKERTVVAPTNVSWPRLRATRCCLTGLIAFFTPRGNRDFGDTPARGANKDPCWRRGLVCRNSGTVILALYLVAEKLQRPPHAFTAFDCGFPTQD